MQSCVFLLWHYQEVIEAQEKTISNLLKAVREQHDQLDNQKLKIKNLEEKVTTVQQHVTAFRLRNWIIYLIFWLLYGNIIQR